MVPSCGASVLVQDVIIFSSPWPFKRVRNMVPRWQFLHWHDDWVVDGMMIICLLNCRQGINGATLHAE